MANFIMLASAKLSRGLFAFANKEYNLKSPFENLEAQCLFTPNVGALVCCCLIKQIPPVSTCFFG